MKWMKGREVAQYYHHEIASQVSQGKAQPTLAVVLVGDNPASQTYVRAKTAACRKVGIATKDLHLPGTTAEHSLCAVIQELNNDRHVHAILVQLPLPPHLDVEKVVQSIDPRKDVDAFHPHNLGALLRGAPRLVPCTALGIIKLLEWYHIDLQGKEVVIVNRSLLVGKPLALLCAEKAKGRNATVTLCHGASKDLSYHTKHADVLVVAVGKPDTITPDMVKPQAVVIDVGINRVAANAGKTRVQGDVAASVAEVAGYLSPVPGGVGPMTIAMLMHNTLICAQQVVEEAR